MRTLGAGGAALLCALACAAGAQAAPTLTLSVKPGRVQGFRGTGDKAGAGAMLAVRINISGNEYGGYPPPLEHLDLSLPAGMRFDTSAFETFPLSYLNEPQVHPGGPGGCSYFFTLQCGQAVRVGAPAIWRAVAAFGHELVPEALTAQTWDDSAGGVTVFGFGHEPVLLEFFAKSSRSPTGTTATGRTLQWSVPEVETVPGAQDVSLTELSINLGSGVGEGRHRRFSLLMPRACRHRSLRFSVAAEFYALGGLSLQTSTATYRAPCPRKRAKPSVPSKPARASP
jgi:hypothetical protein